MCDRTRHGASLLAQDAQDPSRLALGTGGVLRAEVCGQNSSTGSEGQGTQRGRGKPLGQKG